MSPPTQTSGRALLTLHSKTLHRELELRARRLVGKDLDGIHSPDDIVQSALVKAWEKADDFLGSTFEDLFRWVAKILSLEVRNIRRKAASRDRSKHTGDSSGREAFVHLDKLESDFLNPEEWLEMEEFQKRVRSALNHLSELDRELISLIFLQEKTFREAGSLRGVRLSTVYKSIQSSLSALQRALRGFVESEYRL